MGRVSSISPLTPTTRSMRAIRSRTRCSACSATTPRSMRIPEVQARRTLLEWYVQDTWKAGQRVTLDLGLRFLYYRPWYSTLPTAVFVPERYDPAQAPRLYQPARINNQNVAFDPVTGQDAAEHLRRQLRARTPATSTTEWSRTTIRTILAGFRDNSGHSPGTAGRPRLGHLRRRAERPSTPAPASTTTRTSRRAAWTAPPTIRRR